MYRLLGIILSAAFLFGCQTLQDNQTEVVETEQDPLYRLLAGATSDVDKSYRVLAETRNALATQMLSEEEKSLAYDRATKVPKGFEKTVGLENWYGPLDSLAYQIGFWTNYKVEIYRAPLEIPMIRIDYKKVSVFEIYKQLRIQVGDRAFVSAEGNVLKVVYPELGS